MQVGPISSRAPDARHAILTYASCCAATRHLGHATPFFTPHNLHASSSTAPSILHSCWGTAPTRNSSRVSRPPCRGIVNHTAGNPPSILNSRGHLDHQTGNKPGNIPCDSLVIGQPAVFLYEGIIRYAAIAGNARGPQPWRARPRQLVRVE